MDESRMLNPMLIERFATSDATAIAEICAALAANDGNLSATARTLSISIDTLRRWLRKEPRLARARDKARIDAIREGRG